MSLSHHELNAVNLGPWHDPKWYAPEQLWILPDQMYRRTVPDKFMKSMFRVACLKPPEARPLIEVEALEAMGIEHTHNDVTPFVSVLSLS
jgi:eukaryotic translation initiation factor 2C